MILKQVFVAVTAEIVPGFGRFAPPQVLRSRDGLLAGGKIWLAGAGRTMMDR
jgi:hypothetical protein